MSLVGGIIKPSIWGDIIPILINSAIFIAVYSTRLKTPFYNDHFKMPNRTCSSHHITYCNGQDKKKDQASRLVFLCSPYEKVIIV